jgi:medium-chain acyl-[acyl-carrier-protein] hydrolase
MSVNPPASTWIFGRRNRPAARWRLFCLPHAGGGASFFRQWGQYFPEEIEVCPVQLPGRETRIRETPRQHFPSLVAELAHALAPYLDKPYAFLGHSMGALLSYGLTLHLRSQGLPLPVQIFASAYRAPHLPAPDPWHDLPEAQLIEKLIELSSSNREMLVNEELRSFFLPVVRADFAVCESYQHAHEEPLACPLTVLGGLQDTRVKREALEAWRVLTSQSFALHMLPGDHFYLQNWQRQLSQLISTSITQGVQAPLLF